jgi:hypothetical protein
MGEGEREEERKIIIKDEERAGQKRGARLKEVEGGKFDFSYSYFLL